MNSITFTWDSITAIEPRLLQLEQEIACGEVPQEMPDYWREWVRYQHQMQELVGWEAASPALQNSEAFNAAYDRLLDIYERRAAEIAGRATE